MPTSYQNGSAPVNDSAADARVRASDAGALRYRSPVEARGYTLLYNCVLLDNRLSDGGKVTYMVLLTHAQQQESCFPGQDKLAAERSVSTRTIRDHLKELQALGLITIERRGKTLSNTYWIEDLTTVYVSPKSDRKKSSGHPESDRKKTAGQVIGRKLPPKNNVLYGSANADIFIEELRTFNVGESPDLYKIPESIQAVITLTGDTHSTRRFMQLQQICDENRCPGAWSEALRSLEKRMKKKSEPALERPGAYFCSALVAVLNARGVAVPVGGADEREEIRGAIAASLGGAK